MADNTKPSKRKGNASAFPSNMPLNTDPGDNSKYLAHAMTIMNWPPIDKNDPEQIRARLQQYFTLCAENDMKPTVKGFLNALKLAKSTLWEWKQGNYRADTHQGVILEAYDLLEALWEDYMQNGKINPVSGIFLGKNNFGYQDKQEYVVTPNASGISEIDVKAIEDKYAELPND